MNTATRKQVLEYFASGKSTPIDLAYKLTRAYAGAGNPDPRAIPGLFFRLAELFVDLAAPEPGEL